MPLRRINLVQFIHNRHSLRIMMIIIRVTVTGTSAFIWWKTGSYRPQSCFTQQIQPLLSSASWDLPYVATHSLKQTFSNQDEQTALSTAYNTIDCSNKARLYDTIFSGFHTYAGWMRTAYRNFSDNYKHNLLSRSVTRHFTNKMYFLFICGYLTMLSTTLNIS